MAGPFLWLDKSLTTFMTPLYRATARALLRRACRNAWAPACAVGGVEAECLAACRECKAFPARVPQFERAEDTRAGRSVAFAIVVALAWRPDVSLRATLLCVLPTSVCERGNGALARRVGLLLGFGARFDTAIFPRLDFDRDYFFAFPSFAGLRFPRPLTHGTSPRCSSRSRSRRVRVS